MGEVIIVLNIYLGEFRRDCIVDVTFYFNRNKERDWFNRPEVKRIIYSVDKTVAVKDEYLESPVFGGMSPERLSCGCKAVILMECVPGANVYATKCGDNCVPEILEVASSKEVYVTLHHPIKFPDSGFEAKIMDSGKIIHTFKEWIDEYYKIRD